VLWAVMLVIALLALGWLVVNGYPDIWQEISRKRVATLIGIVVALTVIIVLLALGGASLGWTGFSDKKLWHWLELLGTLAIPVVLAVAGFWFTAQQDARQQKIEDRRAKAEQELAAQRAQDEALQTYLGQVGTLLLKEDLRSAEAGSEVRTLARARTLTVLGRLGPDRKRTVIEFLYEASLINGDNPAIPLNNANLSGIDLSSRYLKDRRITGDPNLEGINLRGADLSEADLRSANLTEADLSGADLSEADLRWAYLYDAKLFRADLREADLSGANINNGLPPDDLVHVSKADTSVVSLQGADLTQADLSGADLSSADLSGAEQLLSGADLSGVDLSNADLKSARLPPRGLPDVDLSGADLRGADTLFITSKKLAKQAKSLKGATMPNGQKYKEWLQDKEGREKERDHGSS
jgi:uncharacterized protein YjbI with pentapeptide repeats